MKGQGERNMSDVRGLASALQPAREDLVWGMGGTYREIDLYHDPRTYDIVFDDGTAEEVDFLEAVYQRYGPKRKALRVLEPACGTGRLLREWARREVKGHGFDLSPDMLGYARETAAAEGLRGLSFAEARMESFSCPLRGVTLVASLISSFKYLLDERSATAHFERVAHALVPGGLFVLGLHLSDYARTRPVHERWVATRDGFEVVCNTRTWPADRRRRREWVRCRMQIRDLENDELRRQQSQWEFRTYDAAQLKRTLRKVPSLRLVEAFDFAYDLDSPRAFDDSQEDIILVFRREA